MSGLKLRLVPCPEDRSQSTIQEQNEIETQSKKVSINLHRMRRLLILMALASPEKLAYLHQVFYCASLAQDADVVNMYILALQCKDNVKIVILDGKQNFNILLKY